MSLSVEIVSSVKVGDEHSMDPLHPFDLHFPQALKGLPISNGHSNSPSPTEELEETESTDSPEPLNLHEAHMVNGEDWNHITKPGEHDVLLGRGGGTNNHTGNVKFRKLVNEHKMRYLACSKVEKPKVARQVVALWRKLDPPGRFLARQDESKRGPGSIKSQDNVWYEVGDKKAREKASQCLRERTPDVIPYIKHLREQQNAITEQGVSFVQMQMQQQEQPMLSGPVVMSVGSMNHHVFRASPPQQVLHPQAMPHHPAGMSHQLNHLQNYHPNNSFFDPSHQQQGMPNQQQFQMQQQQQAMQQLSRRNSSPSQQGTHSFGVASDRRSSLQGNTPFGNLNSGGVDPFAMSADPSEMTEMEYQQHMMMMQQQMQMQQMQMQRLQQSRMQANMHRMNSVGNHEDPSPQYAPEQLRSLHNQDLPHLAESSVAAPTKRNRCDGDADATKNNGKERVAPDRAVSYMSLTPANPSDDNELSLEDYRQQLEEYIANIGNGGSTNENKTGKSGDPHHTQADDDEGNESDLEDDWEKEREKAVQQAQASQHLEKRERGVNRNVSAMSFQSTGGISLVSGFSGFTDMMNAPSAREKKMDMARSACSNLSLMSEITDLSQNIDNLSLYDD